MSILDPMLFLIEISVPNYMGDFVNAICTLWVSSNKYNTWFTKYQYGLVNFNVTCEFQYVTCWWIWKFFYEIVLKHKEGTVCSYKLWLRPV